MWMSGDIAIRPIVTQIFSIPGLLVTTGVRSRKHFSKPLLLLRTRLCFLIPWLPRHESGYAGLFLVTRCKPGSRRLGAPGLLLLREGLDVQPMGLCFPVNCKTCVWTREAICFIPSVQLWRRGLDCSKK